MEFCEKLPELRKQKNLTQEELAGAIFVSRTAISKWESGRGYPSIDSLRQLSGFFDISLDDLLSSEELLSAARQDGDRKIDRVKDLIFGLLDCAVSLFLFLPFFSQKTGTEIRSVSLLAATSHEKYITVAYFAIVFSLIFWGIATLALQGCTAKAWLKCKRTVSLLLSAIGILAFSLSLEPYAAAFSFLFFLVKGMVLLRRS